ncbi:MAG: hypothetical protein EPO11_08095 [Gammaproteobacteria bacterium]|nr:MAG: hypothetical protein EPO11_08095 [Gammaproteobacteria bacterium]
MLSELQINTIYNLLAIEKEKKHFARITTFGESKDTFIVSFKNENTHELDVRVLYVNYFGKISVHTFPTMDNDYHCDGANRESTEFETKFLDFLGINDITKTMPAQSSSLKDQCINVLIKNNGNDPERVPLKLKTKLASLAHYVHPLFKKTPKTPKVKSAQAPINYDPFASGPSKNVNVKFDPFGSDYDITKGSHHRTNAKRP